MVVIATPIVGVGTGTAGTLMAIRAEVAKKSGRYDLVLDADGDDWSDNGLDVYINAGLKLLDGMLPHFRLKGRHLVEVVAGTRIITLTYIRSVDDVWLIDPASDDSWTPLEVVELEEFLVHHWEGDIEQGTPAYWTTTVAGLSTEQREFETADLADFDSVDDIHVLHPYGRMKILLSPPADTTYTIQVFGNFYSPVLSGDDDFCFWTKQHSDFVVLAALYELEVAYRNTTGANDWYAALSRKVLFLQKDEIEREMGKNPFQMEG